MKSYLRHSLKLFAYCFQIDDDQDIYRECSVKDQKLLAIFIVDTVDVRMPDNSMDTGNEQPQQNLRSSSR